MRIHTRTHTHETAKCVAPASNLAALSQVDVAISSRVAHTPMQGGQIYQRHARILL